MRFALFAKDAPTSLILFLSNALILTLSRHLHHDLADMRIAGHAGESLARLGEAKAMRNDGIDSMGGDGAQHRFEILAMAAGDALQAHLTHHGERQVDHSFGAGENADQRDRSAGTNETQGSVERIGAADLDDEVDRAAGKFARPGAASRARRDN